MNYLFNIMDSLDTNNITFTSDATVKKVLWKTQYSNDTSFLCPVIEIYPIKLGNYILQYIVVDCAKFIKDNIVGNGSVINIVIINGIPSIHSVNSRSTYNTYEFPVCPYINDSTSAHIYDITNFVNGKIEKLRNANIDLMNIIWDVCANNAVPNSYIVSYALEKFDTTFDDYPFIYNEKRICNEKMILRSHFHAIIGRLKGFIAIVHNQADLMSEQYYDKFKKAIEMHVNAFLRDIWFREFQIQFNTVIRDTIIALCEEHNILFTDCTIEKNNFVSLKDFTINESGYIQQVKQFQQQYVKSYNIANCAQTYYNVCYNWTPIEFIAALECADAEGNFEQIIWTLAQGLIGNKSRIRETVMREFVSLCEKLNMSIPQKSSIKTILNRYFTKSMFSHDHQKSFIMKDIMMYEETYNLVHQMKNTVDANADIIELRKQFILIINEIRNNLFNKQINLPETNIIEKTQTEKRSLDNTEYDETLCKKNRVS